MRINDPRVRRRLGEIAHDGETPSQLVARILRERDDLEAQVAQLRRQVRYHCQRVKLLEVAEQERNAPPEHLTEEQARNIALARERYFASRR